MLMSRSSNEDRCSSRKSAACEVQLSEAVELHETPHKGGVGAFARHAIARGDNILTEAPLLQWRCAAHDQATNAAIHNLVVSTLDVTDRAAYWNLHQDAAHGSAKTALGVWLSNSFPTDGTDDGRNSVAQRSAAIFKGYSRFNHSCRPNAHGCWNARRGKQTIHALRPIEAGEEITVDYLGVCGATRADRQRSLISDMGFVCKCVACSLSGDALDASNRRQARIGVLHALIAARLRGAVDIEEKKEGAAAAVPPALEEEEEGSRARVAARFLDLVCEQLELMEVEGLDALAWDLLWAASEHCRARNDQVDAVKWAARAAECARLALGEASDEHERYHRRATADGVQGVT